MTNFGGVYTETVHVPAFDITVSGEGTDAEYRIYAPTNGFSGRAVLYCHPWGGNADSVPGTNLYGARLAKGDVLVTVQGGVWDSGATPDEPVTTGVFSDSATVGGQWWTNHQSAMNAAEAAYPIIAEWHVVGLSFGAFGAGFAACKSTQAIAGKVKSCTLVAGVTDLDYFYNDANNNFENGLDIGFDSAFSTNSANMDLVNFSATEYARPGHWLIMTGSADVTVDTAAHGTALETAIGSNAFVKRIEDSGADHFTMGILISLDPRRISNFIDSVTERTPGDSVNLPEQIGGRQFYLGVRNGAGLTIANFDSVDTEGIGIKFRKGDEVSWIDILLFRYVCLDATPGSTQWFRLPDAWTELFRYLAVVNNTATGGVAINCGAGNGAFRGTMTGNVTWSFTGWRASGYFDSVIMFVKQNATGGWTHTWPTVKWIGGTPSPSTTLNTWSVFKFYSTNGGATVFGEMLGTGIA